MKTKTSGLVGTFLFLIAFMSWQPALAAEEQEVEKFIQDKCSTCHKFSGEPESKFNLIAPDLMWAGNKYQRTWLLRWLTGKEDNLYPNSFRWDISREPARHPTLSETEANDVANYFEKHFLDSRIKKSFVDLSTLTEMEASFGADIYKSFSCLGCHQIKEDGKLIGGPISVNLFDAGKRYNLDWWSRFAENPQDFTPHSGEYLADLSPLGARYIIGYLMTLGVDDFKFHEPWKEEAFKKADASRGEIVYKEYCTQCHGAKGEGDGPGAMGLDPKPAVHTQMALNEMPEDYLYNVIYYGGKSVGKSPNMPDWGMTIPKQDMADLIKFLRVTFKGAEDKAETSQVAKVGKVSGDCPQPFKTKKAPANFLKKKNPLSSSPTEIKAGELLFQKNAKPMACAQCHGKSGDGKGKLGVALKPKPRNFSCSETMKEIPDGQLFWIIKNGSPGTGMMAFKQLKDKQIWQLILYIRGLEK
jgi:mono/diheme cytochrome c family protein